MTRRPRKSPKVNRFVDFDPTGTFDLFARALDDPLLAASQAFDPWHDTRVRARRETEAQQWHGYRRDQRTRALKGVKATSFSAPLSD